MGGKDSFDQRDRLFALEYAIANFSAKSRKLAPKSGLRQRRPNPYARAAAAPAPASSTWARLSRVRMRIRVAARPRAAITAPPRNALWNPLVRAARRGVPPARR